MSTKPVRPPYPVEWAAKELLTAAGFGDRVTSAGDRIDKVWRDLCTRREYGPGGDSADSSIAGIMLEHAGEPGADEVLAALSLCADAREDFDRVERGLISAARSFGVEWGQIATAMGYAGATGAQRRARLLGLEPEPSISRSRPESPVAYFPPEVTS